MGVGLAPARPPAQAVPEHWPQVLDDFEQQPCHGPSNPVDRTDTSPPTSGAVHRHGPAYGPVMRSLLTGQDSENINKTRHKTSKGR